MQRRNKESGKTGDRFFFSYHKTSHPLPWWWSARSCLRLHTTTRLVCSSWPTPCLIRWSFIPWPHIYTLSNPLPRSCTHNNHSFCHLSLHQQSFKRTPPSYMWAWPYMCHECCVNNIYMYNVYWLVMLSFQHVERVYMISCSLLSAE